VYGDNMKQQIGIILIGSGMILTMMSSSHYHFILNELYEMIRYQWPMVLIIMGVLFLIPERKKSKRNLPK
jgi:hypothetical protein